MYGQASRPTIARLLTETLRRVTGDEAAERSTRSLNVHAHQLGLEVSPPADETYLSHLARVGGLSYSVLCKAAWSGELPSVRRGRQRWVMAGDWEVWLACYRARQGNGTVAVCDAGSPWTGKKRGLPPSRDGDFIPAPNAWTDEEDRFLVDNLGVIPEEEIARALGRSANAVHLRWTRLGLPAPSKNPEYIVARNISEALGMDSKAAMRWVDLGLLPGRRLPLGSVVRIVRRVTFLRWFINPRNWIYFRLGEHIQDPHLRRLLELKKERWGDEWWTPGQVAAYHGVDHRDVNRYIHAGKLAATKWGNWWILKSEATRPDLVFYKGKGCGPDRHWPESLDVFVVLARAVGLSYHSIADLTKTGRSSVPFRLRSLHERGGIPALIEEHGLRVLYDADSGRLLADWKAYRDRFPALARAMARFEQGKLLTPADTAMVAGVLAAWGEWKAETDKQRVMAGALRHAANFSQTALLRAYARLWYRGIDPLGTSLFG